MFKKVIAMGEQVCYNQTDSRFFIVCAIESDQMDNFRENTTWIILN